MNPKLKISTARYIAMNQAPYFATVLYKLVFHEVPLGTLSKSGQGTLAMTPKGSVLYEVEAVNRWSERQLATVIIHEINHLIRQHHRRMGTRNPGKWNLACDAEINDDLQAMGLPLPDVPVVPEQFGCARGLSAEEYFLAIDDAVKDDQSDTGDIGGCGGCCTGRDSAEGEALDDKSGRTEMEMEATLGAVAESLREFAKRGFVPSGLARWAKERCRPPKISWEVKLARACRRAVEMRTGEVDYRYSRISRKQAAVGFGAGVPIFPSLVSPVPNVAVGLDTSGSMGHNEIIAGASETAGIMKAAGTDVTFLACDEAVNAVQKVHSVLQLAALIKGGGGTDFRPIFSAVEQLKPRPELFVFITDGGGPAPIQPPKGIHVIWLLCGPHRCKPNAGDWGNAAVTWGEFIEMETDDTTGH